MRSLFIYLKNYKKETILAPLFKMLEATFELIVPLVVASIIDNGIKNGDLVRVFNPRGELRIPAKVTPRIMPGVAAMGQGAWHDANMDGDRIDRGACINTLTTQRPSPLAKGNPQHTNLVDIARVEDTAS